LLNIIFALTLAILGGVWRRLDGEGGQVGGFHLVPLIWIVPVLCYDLMLGCGLLIAWVSLLDGFNGWTNFGVMAKRYTFYSLITCLFIGISKWYILFGLISGLCYPIGAWYTKNYNKDFKYTEYCEYIAGALMFGGVVFLI
tara:strand:- start:34875 stop:35297 length:423 start_codon:yes stop_codon:yes gene_type:complete